MKKIVALCLVLALTLCPFAVTALAEGETAEEPVELIVFAAASMTETLTKIGELYTGENPNVTLIMDSETLKGITSGETDGMQAFMAGKLRAEGDMMLAMKLGELFPV